MRLIRLESVKEKVRLTDWQNGDFDDIPVVKPAAGEWKPLSDGLPEKVDCQFYIARYNDRDLFDMFWWNGTSGEWESCHWPSLRDDELAYYYSHYAEIQEVER